MTIPLSRTDGMIRGLGGHIVRDGFRLWRLREELFRYVAPCAGQLAPVVFATFLTCIPSTSAQPSSDGSRVMTLETGEYQVPPGELFECFYLMPTERELRLTSGLSRQPGGHHMSVYYTDTPRSTGHHPCSHAEMATWHFVTGSGGHNTLALPEGIARKVPAGKQMVLLAHYVNSTEATVTTHAAFDLYLADETHVKADAGVLTMDDSAFAIPPSSTHQSIMTCRIPRTIQVVVLAGHMHESGTRYTLEVVDEDGMPVRTLYDQEWQPSYYFNPPVQKYPMEEPLVLSAGTRLRQTCQWHNSTNDTLRYPDEMCNGMAFYFPDQGEILCEFEARREVSGKVTRRKPVPDAGGVE